MINTRRSAYSKIAGSRTEPSTGASLREEPRRLCDLQLKFHTIDPQNTGMAGPLVAYLVLGRSPGRGRRGKRQQLPSETLSPFGAIHSEKLLTGLGDLHLQLQHHNLLKCLGTTQSNGTLADYHWSSGMGQSSLLSGAQRTTSHNEAIGLTAPDRQTDRKQFTHSDVRAEGSLKNVRPVNRS